jgi:hypothetical protein
MEPGEHLRDVEGLGQKALDLARAIYGLLVRLFKAALANIKEAHSSNAKVYVCAIGLKAVQFLAEVSSLGPPRRESLSSGSLM